MRVSFGGVSTTDDSLYGSYEKPKSALPWQVQQISHSRQVHRDVLGFLRRPEAGNPLARTLELEPEPEPEPEPELEREWKPEQVANHSTAERAIGSSSGAAAGAGAGAAAAGAAGAAAAAAAGETQLSSESTKTNLGPFLSIKQQGAKKDSNFKAKLRADNARLQQEIERLRSQLYADPDDPSRDGPSTPTGEPDNNASNGVPGTELVSQAGVSNATPTDL